MRKTIGEYEAVVADLVARLSPWLAPLPTAYLVYRSTKAELGWHPFICAVAGAVVEALGLSAVHTALEFRSHNNGLGEGDNRKAPFVLAVCIVAGYLVSVTTLTVILDTAPQAAKLAPLVFPVLSLCGVTVLAIRADHRRRVEEMILSLAPPYNKKQHRLEKKRLLAEMETQPAPQPVAPAPQPAAKSNANNGHKPHACAYCGATANASGEPFRSKNAVSAHLRYCAVYQSRRAMQKTQEATG